MVKSLSTVNERNNDEEDSQNKNIPNERLSKVKNKGEITHEHIDGEEQKTEETKKGGEVNN